MIYFILLPLILGLAGFFQGALNRSIAVGWGIPGATLFNSLVFFAPVVVLYAWSLKSPGTLPEYLAPKDFMSNFKWWYILPGLCGFIIVVLVPVGIAKVGALNLFVGIIAAQLVASLAWDSIVEGQPATWPRVLGAILAFLGAALGILI